MMMLMKIPNQDTYEHSGHSLGLIQTALRIFAFGVMTKWINKLIQQNQLHLAWSLESINAHVTPDLDYLHVYTDTQGVCPA